MLALKSVSYDDAKGFYSARVRNSLVVTGLNTTITPASEIRNLACYWKEIYSYWDGITISAACPGVTFWIDKQVIPHPPSDTPHEDCSCGIYGGYVAFHLIQGPTRVRGLNHPPPGHFFYSGDILLLIDGYGKLIPADEGFRAQHAVAVGIIDRETIHADVIYTGKYINIYSREARFEPVFSSLEYQVSEKYGLPVLSLREAIQAISAEHDKPFNEHITWL